MMLALVLLLADLSSLAGFYASSQHEVAAAIDLEADGKFAYSLDYGAVSEAAEGTWTSDGKAIYLTSTRMQGAYKQTGFVREPLMLDGTTLVLNRYDTSIRFNRDDSLPTPPNRNSKLDKKD